MTAQTLHPPRGKPTVSTDLGSLVQRLSAIRGGSHHILSCYIRLDPQDRTRATYLIELKDRVKALRTDPMVQALGRDERLAIERDLARVLEYLRHPGDLPHTPGLAIFACEELGLLEAVPLARVHRTRLLLDDTPWMAELVASEHDTQPILTVVIDRAHARFFVVTAMGRTELACLTAGSTRGGKFHSDRGDAPGWGEHDYHRRIEQEHHRHYANVVQRVEEIVHTRPVRGIVLVGPKDHTSALARFLPDQLAEGLLGTAKLNPTAINAAELQATSLGVAEVHRRKLLGSELKALDDAVGSGWAVNGPRETLRALHRGQVRTLFVRDDLEGRGFRCAGTGRLVLAKGDCRNEGQPQAVRDLVDEAIEEALRQRVRVVTVPDCTEAEPVDGFAATLRYR